MLLTIVRVAVLATVFNRREITLKGLRSLYDAIESLGDMYHFDIYITDDGCTDGTADALRLEFPQVRIVKGDGNQFWGGGMNLAWRAAIAGNEMYDYYLWYNDDSDVFPDALQTMFDTVSTSSDKAVITGAFKGSDGQVSYGGKLIDDQLINPNGQPQDVVKMNGNLVLIPHSIFQIVGLIDKHYIHGGGDFDYGYKVKENGFRVLLTPKYVGVADRHDQFIPKYCNKSISLSKRWEILHNPINSPIVHFRYNMKREGFFKAVVYYIIAYIGVLFPWLYVRIKKAIKSI